MWDLWGYGCESAKARNPELKLAPGELATTQGGDSGGPLLIEGKLAGFVKGGGGWTLWTDRGYDDAANSAGKFPVRPDFRKQPFFKYSQYTNLWKPGILCFIDAVKNKSEKAGDGILFPQIDMGVMKQECKTLGF